MLINISDLSYRIGDRTLLDHINLIIEEKDKVALVGLNGAGKSTLLKLIVSRNEKSITYGKDLSISYLPQNSSFDDELTIFKQAKLLAPKSKDYEISSTLNKFKLTNHEDKIKILSGGQKKRLALSIALLNECDLLILDEPTNHLDTTMIEYLEKYLIKRNKALLMITHDRYFLERITNKIVEIDRGHLYEYNANYSAFIEMKAKREQDALNQEYKRKQFLKKELEWVRAGVQARTTKRKSRLQQFEKLSQIEDIQNVESVKMINTSSRLGKKTLTLENVSKVYDGTPLFHPFSYQFKRFDRIGILGENGSGKTTLMNMIAQLDQDYEGTISIGETIRFGYFKQGVEDMDPSMRIIDYIKETSDFLETSEGTLTASAMCERFLFDKSMQFTRIERLSGGEKRRLYLLKVLMGAPNVLLLDEPTNDLDIDTLNILEDYLESFKGIIITVSHDRYFLDKIVDGLLVFKDHYVTYVNGGYSSQIDITSTKEKKESKKEAYRETKKQNQKRRLTWAEKKELESIDDVILDLENDIKKIDEEMQTTTEFEKLDELSSLRQEKEQELEEKNERYLELLEIEEG